MKLRSKIPKSPKIGGKVVRTAREIYKAVVLTSLRNDSVVNYESIWTQFSKSVTRQDVLCNALNISQIRL